MPKLKSLIQEICKNPFRLYFPMAFLVALYASGLWIAFVFFKTGAYPGLEHARLFVGGYLYFCVLGFLMTAIPRFTQTQFLQSFELITSVFLILALLTVSLLEQERLFWSFISLGWILLIQFAVRRFYRRKQNPPYTFLFVGAGVALGFIGSLMMCLSLWAIAGHKAYLAGKVLFYDGMVMSLILGVGGRLIPGILGFKEVVSMQRKSYERPLPFLMVVPFDVYALVFLFLTSLALEILGLNTAGWSLRALVISYISIKFWNLHRSPPEKKQHGLFLRLSSASIVLASWLIAVFPNQALSLKHLIYIAGYSLLTFLIASRVILAHGDSDLSLEYKKMPYAFFGSFFLLAALTRASATLLPDSYMNHLGYAAATFLAASLVWGFVFIPKTLAYLKN